MQLYDDIPHRFMGSRMTYIIVTKEENGLTDR